MSSHSALQAWTSWDLNTPLPPLGNCGNSSCAEICFSGNFSPPNQCYNRDSLEIASSTSNPALWDPHSTTNLVICGLWWTVAMATHWFPAIANGSANTTVFDRSKTLAAFSQVGLDLPADGFSTPKIPALDCFADVASYKASGDALNLGKSAPPFCSVDFLFGYNSLMNMAMGYENEDYYEDENEDNGYFNPISACIHYICSSKTPLNQDIGGIGVFTSFMMQSSIAIIAFLSLICLRYLPPLRRSTRGKENFDILVTAVVEFQKAQCYFAGAIQIATLVLAAGQGSYSSGDWDDYINDELFYIIATNGYIPVVFTLAYISKFGRRSWYLILLSSISMILSTVTLSEVSRIFNGVPADYATDGSVLCGDCGGHSAKDLIAAWCPPKTSTPYVGNFRAAKGWWNWVIWLICLFWLVFTASKMDMSILTKFAGRWLPGHRYLQQVGRVVRKIGSPFAKVWGELRLYHIFFPLSWTVAFGYQYGGFVLFFLHSEIANNWSFGQIVAITVWVPCVAEFIYLLRHGMTEGSRYRLPHDYAVERATTESDSPAIPKTWNDDTEMQGLVGQTAHAGTWRPNSDGFVAGTSYDPIKQNDVIR